MSHETIWKAIDMYVAACGGDARITVERQQAAQEVDRLVTASTLPLLSDVQLVERFRERCAAEADKEAGLAAKRIWEIDCASWLLEQRPASEAEVSTPATSQTDSPQSLTTRLGPTIMRAVSSDPNDPAWADFPTRTVDAPIMAAAGEWVGRCPTVRPL